MTAPKRSDPGNQLNMSRSATPLELRYAEAAPRLSYRRRQLVKAILEAPHETFYLSSRALARRYGVDAATIVRTIQALGYGRFADFAADLRRHFVLRITPYSVMKATAGEGRSLSDHLARSLETDAQNLAMLRAGIDAAGVTNLARAIHRARRTLVIGVDLASSLASFLAYGLAPLGHYADAPVGSAGNLQHRVNQLDRKDLLIAISFGRCLRETVVAVQRARERGAPTFGITDSDATPLARLCDSHLLASISSPSITGSYVAPMALLNAVLLACAHLQPRRSLARLREMEREYTEGTRWYQDPAEARPARRSGAAARSKKGA